MTLSLSVNDEQLGQYMRRVFAIADRLGKSLPFDSVMDALQNIHDGKFGNPAVAVIPSEPVVKFALLADLGIITVPDGYVSATQLGSFKGSDGEKFYYFNENITDANFPNPSRVLKPGDRLWVRAHKQIVAGTTTSEERMAFLATLDSHHTGAQGASLVFDQKRDQLPKGYWYASFDEKKRLWYDRPGRTAACRECTWTTAAASTSTSATSSSRGATATSFSRSATSPLLRAELSKLKCWSRQGKILEYQALFSVLNESMVFVP